MFESRSGLRFVQATRLSSAAAYFVEQRKEPEGLDSRVCVSLVTFFGTSKRK
jgi:hypothetical protein